MPAVLLTGPETIEPWLHSLVRRAKQSSCQHILFPSSGPHQDGPQSTAATTSKHSSSSSSSRHRNREAPMQAIADRLARETACRLVRESVPGHIWAYMLTLVVDADELFADPALAVRMARVAATRANDAPLTDRDWVRLRYEARGAVPEDYPSRAHYEQGRKWLDVVVKRHRLGQTGQV